MEKWNYFLKQFFGKTTNGKIAKHLYNLEEKILTTTLTLEAKNLQIAPSTIVKFLQGIGFNGWKDYTIYARVQMSLIKPQSGKISTIIQSKIDMMEWIEIIYRKQILKISQKIISAHYVILIAHGSTISLLQFFKRTLDIIGKNCLIYDMSDKYLNLKDHTNTIYFVFSLSGKNEHLKWILEKFKHINLATSYFISASNTNFEVFNFNLNLKTSPIKLDPLEAAIPLNQICFVQHLMDLITNNLINNKKVKIDQQLKKSGLIERLKK